MRLPVSQRIAIFALSCLLLAVSFLRSGEWPVLLVIALTLGGLFGILVVIVGALPGGNWREFHLKWPETDLLHQVEDLRRELDVERTTAAADRAAAEARIEELATHHRDLADLVKTYLLAQEDAPDDEMTDRERLAEWEDHMNSLDSEISKRYFTGETYDDGIDVTQLEESMRRQRAAFQHEEDRQEALRRFPDGKPRGFDPDR